MKDHFLLISLQGIQKLFLIICIIMSCFSVSPQAQWAAREDNLDRELWLHGSLQYLCRQNQAGCCQYWGRRWVLFMVRPLLYTLMATFCMVLCHLPLLYTLMATFYMVVLCDLPIALHTDGHILHASLWFAHYFTHWWPHFTWLFFVIFPLLYTLMVTFYMVLCYLPIGLCTDGYILPFFWSTAMWSVLVCTITSVHFAVLSLNTATLSAVFVCIFMTCNVTSFKFFYVPFFTPTYR